MSLLDNHGKFNKFKIAHGLNQRTSGNEVSKYIAWSTIEKKLKGAFEECRPELLKAVYLRKSRVTNRVVTTHEELSLLFDKYLQSLSGKNSVEAWNKIVRQAEQTDYQAVILEGMKKYIKPTKDEVSKE
jgi:sugar diacid utilization regulator